MELNAFPLVLLSYNLDFRVHEILFRYYRTILCLMHCYDISENSLLRAEPRIS